MNECDLSIIVPARNEKYLQKTITDLLTKAEGNVEVIAILDGYWPSPRLIDDSRLKIIHRGSAMGMRAAINAGVGIARGKYLMKSDAHCMFSQGYDKTLISDCQENWVVVPRRYSLDPVKWEVTDNPRYPVDYMYLNFDLHGADWKEKTRNPEYKEKLVDDLMSSQGSVWFMPKKLFYSLDLMDEGRWGTFYSEFQEVGIKAWLSGFAEVKINKKAFYAHWYKGRTFGRGYRILSKDRPQADDQVKKWFKFREAWDKQKLPLSWLIEKFWPVPTWPEDKSLWKI